MKLPKPFGDRILVRRSKHESKGKIIYAIEAKKNEGQVVAIGYGNEKSVMKLSVGQMIMFSAYGSIAIDIEEDKDNEYLLMNQNDVLAILNEEES